MSESIYKNNELENEVSSDMSYFWYSDAACDKDNDIERNKEGKESCNIRINSFMKRDWIMTFDTLTLKLPTLVYTWYDEVGTEHCSVDMLLISGTTMTQLKVAVQKGGC